MRTSKWLALALLCCLAAAPGCCFRGRKDGNPAGAGSDRAGSSADDTEDHKKLCRAKHPPLPPSVASLTGDCPSTGCGLNGTWLGSGVPFRTLHLSPLRYNEANLSILDFQNPAKEHLTPQVDGDILRGKPANSSVAVDVVPGSVLYLGPLEKRSGLPSTPTYTLTITGVNPDQPFWADCPGCTNQGFPTYSFTAISVVDDCEVDFCQPGLSTDPQGQVHNLSGTAVIFRGDYYDDAYTVRTTPPSAYDDDVFNIACLGTAISKLHLFRHTSAAWVTSSAPPPPPTPPAPPAVSQRQALLRLLTADYCGIGHPFTVEGTSIRLGFNKTFTPTAQSKFTLNSSGSVDALWAEGGATCLGTPRLQATAPPILDKIQATCQEALHPLPACPSFVPPFPPPFPMGSSAI